MADVQGQAPLGRVAVVDDRGVLGTVPSEQLEEFLTLHGSRLATESDIKEHRLEKRYGDRPFEAGALGLARSATFGLSDPLLKATDSYTEEELREIEERNETASTVGEVAGLFIPGLGPAKLGRIGLAAGERALGGLAKSALRDIGKRAIGSAVEGAAIAGGHAITEDALGRAPLNAENLITHVGLGALVGGLVGGVGQAASSGLRRSVEGASGLATKVATRLEEKGGQMALPGITQPKLLEAGAERLVGLGADIATDAVFGVPGLSTLTGGILKGPIRAVVRKLASSGIKGGIERGNLTNVQLMGRAVDGIISGVESAGKAAARTSSLLSTELLTLATKDETERESIERLSSDISELASDPSRLVGALASSIAAEAPGTSDALLSRIESAMSFLSDRLPKEHAPTLLSPRKGSIPRSEVARARTILEAAFDPHSAIEAIGRGDLSIERIETLDGIYPELMAELRKRTIDRIIQEQPVIGYRQRLQLARLLGVGIEQTVDPSVVARLQRSGQPPEEEQEQGADVDVTEGMSSRADELAT